MNRSEKIDALKDGDEFIFGEVFKEFHQKVYYYILSKTKSTYIAEEVTQLAFIKLWNKRASLDESVSLSAQLFQIAKTTCIDFLRKESNQSKLTIAGKEEHSFKNDVCEDLDKRELQTKLIRAVQNMPPMRQQVFQLSRYEAKTYKEIAQLLSLSEKTVENHISLALRQLRRVLALFLFFILR